MADPGRELRSACNAVVAEISRLQSGRTTPILVALDGGSGAGKSTLAALIEEQVTATQVQSDDFFAAGIAAARWEECSAEARADLAIDWRRLRAEALEPLLAGRSARWHAFDFEAGVRADGTYPMRADFTRREPAPLIVLDGAYSTRPELADLVDLSVLVDAPAELRHARLAAREEAGFLDSWHARWDAAESYYLARVRPPSAFDLIVTTVAAGVQAARPERASR